MNERLRKSEWVVMTVGLSAAVNLVEEEHYARGAANTAIYRHGLFRIGECLDRQCVGVAIWIPPTRAAAHATYPANWRGVLSLSRLAIRPDVPKNAASFLLGKSMRMIDRTAWPCLVTYADEWRGHTGAIYKATNWQYLGLTGPDRGSESPGGVITRRALPYPWIGAPNTRHPSSSNSTNSSRLPPTS